LKAKYKTTPQNCCNFITHCKCYNCYSVQAYASRFKNKTTTKNRAAEKLSQFLAGFVENPQTQGIVSNALK